MAETKPTGEKKHITGARIAQEIKQYKKDALISPLYTVCCVILEILIPYLTASIIDKGIAVGNMAHVAKIGALMAVMAILAMFFGVRAGVHSARASTGLASNLRESMFGRIQEYSFSNIDRFSTAGLVTRLTTDVTNIQNAFQMILQICTRAPVTLIVALFMAFSVNAKLSLVFLVAMAFLGVMIFVLIPKAMKYFKLMFRKYDAVNGVVQENVGAIRVVKAFVREDYEDEKFSGSANALFKNSISAERIISFSMPIMQLTVYACILSISWFGAKMIVGQTGLTTGELTSLLSYVMNILMSLMMLSMVFVMVTQSAAAAQRIEEVLEEQPDIISPENAVKTVKDGSVDFSHVTFAYQQRSGKPVLSDIDLHIRSGETIGVMGGTGSSKSSLVSLISRLYDVTAGEVRVGGVDVRKYDVESLRDAVSVVLQNNVLFSGTIKENLRWGDPEFHVESGWFSIQDGDDNFTLGTQECETLLSAIARDAENGNWGRYDWFEDDGTAYAMDLSFDFYRDRIDEHGTHYQSYDSIYITVRPEMTETKQALLDLNLATEQDFVTWQELNGITTEA